MNWWWYMLQFLNIGKQSSWHFHVNLLKSTFGWLIFYYNEFKFTFQLLMNKAGTYIEGGSTLMVTPCRDLWELPTFSFLGVASAGLHAIIIFVKQQNATVIYRVIGEGRWELVYVGIQLGLVHLYKAHMYSTTFVLKVYPCRFSVQRFALSLFSLHADDTFLITQCTV